MIYALNYKDNETKENFKKSKSQLYKMNLEPLSYRARKNKSN